MTATIRRRRILAALPIMAIAAAAIGLLTAGGGASAPDGAAKFVPANAITYLHLSSDRGSEGWRRGVDLAKKLPLLDRVRVQMIGASLGPLGKLDADRDVMPWLGDEAAYAELPGASPGANAPLVVLKAKDQVRARATLRDRGRGSAPDYLGAKVFDMGGGNRAAMTPDGWVVFGDSAAMRAALDTNAGRQPALSKAADYHALGSKLPGDRLVSAYLSAAGIQRYAARPLGLLAGAAGTGPARAAEIAFTPKSDHFQFNVRAISSGAGSCSPAGNGNALTDRAPAKPALFVSVSGLDCVLGRALGVSNIGLARGVAQFAALAKKSGVDLGRTVLPLFSKSSALVVDPGGAQPQLTLGVSDVPKGKGLSTVGLLQPAIVGMLDPARSGDTPGFQTGDVKGVKTLSSQLTPALALDYAEKDGDLVVSNGTSGIAQAFGGKHLSGDGDFKKLLGDAPKNATSLVFSDLDKLLALADQAGLAQNPAYAAVRDDLGRVGKAGGFVAREGQQLNAELSAKNP
ncbi:MAG: DUF3352 domain-containing protein [Thermoleophilaceae bacterium]